MKKNLTKKLMLSVLTLAFAVVSLGASTFAWFTMSGTATIGTFQGTVKGGQGLDVGYSQVGGPVTWKTGDITAAEIQNLIDTKNTAGWKFDAVTPVDTFDEATNVYDMNTVSSSASGNVLDSGAGKYVQFSLHFKLSDTSVTGEYELYMNKFAFENITPDWNPSGTNWVADTVYKLNSGSTTIGGTYLYDVRSASRIAFFGSSTDAADTTVLSEVYQFEGDGEYSQGDAYKDGAATGALELYNAKQTNDLVYTASYAQPTAEIENYENAWTDGTLSGTNILVGTLSAGDTITVDIVLWVEGWDAECLNALFSQQISLDLSFCIVEK